MAKTPIGFVHFPDQKTEEKDIVAETNHVEQEFKVLLSDLQIDEGLARQHAALDKRIRKELIFLYKQIKEIEDRAKVRQNFITQFTAYEHDYPKQAMELLDKIDEIHSELMPKMEKLNKEISQHLLQDTADIYKTLQLGAEEIKQIRSLVAAMSTNFNNIASSINASINGQQTEVWRRYILSKHPI